MTPVPPPVASPTPAIDADQPRHDTRDDIRAAKKELSIIAWLSSGFGALVAILGVCAVVLSGAVFVIDRAEAKGTDAAGAVREELHRHVADDVVFHSRIEKKFDQQDATLWRQDQKSDTIILGLGLRNPAPAVPPNPFDAGP